MGGLVEMYNLKELIVPNSNSVGYIGLSHSGKKRVKGWNIANQSVRITQDYNCVGHNVDISYSDSDDEMSAENRVFWRFLLIDDLYER